MTQRYVAQRDPESSYWEVLDRERGEPVEFFNCRQDARVRAADANKIAAALTATKGNPPDSAFGPRGREGGLDNGSV